MVRALVALEPPLPCWAPPQVQLIETHNVLRHWVDDLVRAQDRALGLAVHVDYPGTSHGRDDHRLGQARLLALARDPRTCGQAAGAAVIDLDAVGSLDALVELFSQPDAPYAVFHNAHAGIYRLSARGCPEGDVWAPARLGCTRIAATLLSEGSRRHRDLPSLQECLARVLHHRIEEPALGASQDRHELARFVATRADATRALMRAMTPMLRKRELVAVYQLECRLVPAVVGMERIGVGVDGAAFQRIADQWVRERQDAPDPDRVARLDKLISTYGYWPQEFIRNDRIHALLHPLAADSGRFSCTDPNLQQVPSEHTAPGLRACFRAPTGHHLVIADYAQIELRVAAHLAPCPALRRVFEDGRDPHRATAATITGKAEAEVSDHERQMAKAVNFGFLFGMGPTRFAAYARDSYGVSLSPHQARHAKEAFFATFPGIAAWHKRVGTLGRTGGAITVRTALGRRKRFEPGQFAFNAALNIPVQGTAADGFKRALIAMYPMLRRLGAHGVLCIHDEYVAQVPVDVAAPARDQIVSQMRDAMASVVTTVPIEVEAKIASSWADK